MRPKACKHRTTYWKGSLVGLKLTTLLKKYNFVKMFEFCWQIRFKVYYMLIISVETRLCFKFSQNCSWFWSGSTYKKKKILSKTLNFREPLARCIKFWVSKMHQTSNSFPSQVLSLYHSCFVLSFSSNLITDGCNHLTSL